MGASKIVVGAAAFVATTESFEIKTMWNWNEARNSSHAWDATAPTKVPSKLV